MNIADATGFPATEAFAAAAREAGAAAPEQTLEAVGAELLARWSEPHRHYHDRAHLRACLRQVEHEPIVALAMWAHDAIYDPRSGANEERSALLITGLLTRCQVPAAVVREVARLVRLTAGHATDQGDRRGALLADADLAVLASPWPDYQAYVDAVRAEYAHVPDAAWRVGRGAVLQSLLDLSVLYRLHPQWEQPARTNLSRELATLG